MNFGRNKYKNKKIETPEGVFDSKLEYNRYLFLINEQFSGRIRALKRQVEYELIPKQTRPKIVRLKTKTKVVEEMVERPCCYRADFQYEVPCKVYYKGGIEKDGWKKVVEDTKGSLFMVTPDAKIKKKLMLYVHDIEVKYVTKATQAI